MPNIPIPYAGYTVITQDNGYTILTEPYKVIHERRDLDNYVEAGAEAESYINRELIKNYSFRLNEKGRKRVWMFVESCDKLSTCKKEALYFNLINRIEAIRKRVVVLEPVEMPIPRYLTKKIETETLVFRDEEFSHVKNAPIETITDERLNQQGELKIDPRYCVAIDWYGDTQKRFCVFFPGRKGCCVGAFNTQEEAICFAALCHDHNYDTRAELWVLSAEEMLELFNKSH